MSSAKRKREVQVNFRVSPEELALIEQKMAQLGTVNREAYLRKMALDGYVVKLDLPELKELVSLMRYSSNNLNQLTSKVQGTALGRCAEDTGPAFQALLTGQLAPSAEGGTAFFAAPSSAFSF